MTVNVSLECLFLLTAHVSHREKDSGQMGLRDPPWHTGSLAGARPAQDKEPRKRSEDALIPALQGYRASHKVRSLLSDKRAP